MFPDKEILVTECSSGGWHPGPDFAGNFIWDFENVFVGAVNNYAVGAIKWNAVLDENRGP